MQRWSRCLVIGVAISLVGGSAAAAGSFPPPPAGGFDTTVCHGRGGDPPRNGRLLGHLRRGRSLRSSGALYSIRADGTGLRRETRPPSGYSDRYPAASPDGRSVAFLRFGPRDDSLALMVSRPGRTRARLVKKLPYGFGFSPAWSPDGKWITGGEVGTFTPLLQTATARAISADGEQERPIDAGRWDLVNGSWSPNGRCFAAAAWYQDRGPSTAYTALAGFAVLGADGGQPNTFFPQPPCPAGWPGCGSQLPSPGANAPTYVQWTPDGRGLIALRGLFRTSQIEPDEIDVIRSGLSDANPGKVLVRNARVPHLSPDGRFLSAYSMRRGTFAVFRSNGALVRPFRHFLIDTWAPARR